MKKYLFVIFIIVCFCGIHCYASETNFQTSFGGNTVDVDMYSPTAGDNFAPLFALLSAKFTWFKPLVEIIGVCQLCFHFFNKKLQAWLTANFIDDISAPGTDHDIWTRSILTLKWYRTSENLLRLFGLRLPDIDAYMAQLAIKFPSINNSKITPLPPTA